MWPPSGHQVNQQPKKKNVANAAQQVEPKPEATTPNTAPNPVAEPTATAPVPAKTVPAEAAPAETTPIEEAKPIVPAPHLDSRPGGTAAAVAAVAAGAAVAIQDAPEAATEKSTAKETVAPSPALPSAQHTAAQQTAAQPAADQVDEPTAQPAPVASGTSLSLTGSTADDIWGQAIESVETATATLARAVQRVELSGENTLRLIFSGKLSVTRFDVPEHKNAMIAAVSGLVGQNVRLECKALPPKPVAAKTEPRQSSKDKMQRMREIENSPFVKACIEYFEAEIVKVDHLQ